MTGVVVMASKSSKRGWGGVFGVTADLELGTVRSPIGKEKMEKLSWTGVAHKLVSVGLHLF